MTERENKRLKNFFAHTYSFYPSNETQVLPYLKKILDSYKEWVNMEYLGRFSKEIKLLQRAIRIIETNNISNSELISIINQTEIEREGLPKYWRNSSIKPNRKRDNKVDAIYEYSSKCSKVRFPSKKRSRATWKRFYTMFPNIAKEDGWDGKTSKRMR